MDDNAIVVIDESLAATPAGAAYLQAKKHYESLAVPAHCSVDTVRWLHERISQYPHIYAAGGGGVLDTVKLAVLPDLSDLLKSVEVGRSGFIVLRCRNADRRQVPFIEATPTTIGTGAESSSVALVVNNQHRRRLVLGNAIRPTPRWYDAFYDTLPDELIREGAVEISLRIIGAYVVAQEMRKETDEYALSLLDDLADAVGMVSEDRRLGCSRLARISTLTHGEKALRGRAHFTWPLWYIANELSAACNCRKMEASIPLIPVIVGKAKTGNMPWGRKGRVAELETVIGDVHEWFLKLLSPDKDRALSIVEQSRRSLRSMLNAPNALDGVSRNTLMAWGGLGMPLSQVTFQEMKNVLHAALHTG